MRRFALTLNLTHACPLACTYCYAGEKRDRPMSFETGMKALELALGESPELLDVSFFGGEPLLEWPLLQRLVEAIEQRCAEVGVQVRFTTTTNGVLLDDAKSRWLAAHGFEMGVSIDGARMSQDIGRPMAGGGSSFRATLRGLHAALPHVKRVEAIMVVTPQNVAHVAEGVAFLIEQGVTHIGLNPDVYQTWSDAALQILGKMLERCADLYLEAYRAGTTLRLDYVDAKIISRLKGGYACSDHCDFGVREVAVAPSGRLYPCERLVGNDTGELNIGHLDTGFDEIARLRLRTEQNDTDPDCEGCAVRDRCMNRCGCQNYASTGAIGRPSDFTCFYEQRAIAAADRVANSLWLQMNPAFMKRFYGVG